MKKELIRATVNREHGMKRERRLSSRRALAFVCSIAVLFSSLYISMSPVLADKLICGQKEHTHSADCYEEILVCGQEERDPEIVVHREFSGDFSWHTHSDSCRNEAGEIVCGQQEGYYHLHNEWCLDENGNVICGLDEIAPHSHDASCYAEDGTLICRKDDVPVLTCSEGNISEWEEVVDEGHTHTDDCYGLADTPSCGMKEHTHTADCYEPEKKEEKEPEKKEPEKKEEKEPEKKESEKNKDQEQEKKDPEKKGEEDSEKKDEKDPEKKDSDQTEGKEQGKTDESGENGNTDDPSETDPNAAQNDGEKKDGETPEGEGNPDGTPEGQTGGEQNGTSNPDGTGDGTNENPEGTGEGTDGNPEGTGEGTNENPDGTGEGTNENPEGTGERTDGNPEGTGDGTEGNPEGTGEGTDGNPEGTGEGTDGNPEGTGEGTGVNPEGTGEGTDGNPEGTGDGTENANPDGTEGDPALNGKSEGTEGKEGLEGAEGKEDLEGTEGKEGTEGAEGAEGTEPGTNATDADGNLIGEDGLVEGEEGLTGEEGKNPEGAEEQEPAEPVNYIVGPLVFPGADYTVTANFGVEALFPEGTTLQVREILPGDAEYEQLAAQAESAVVDDEETSVNMMRFFDITFMTEKGEIEPQAPVNIQITYNEVIPDTVDDMVYTLHFAEEGQAPEVLETKTKSVDAATQVEEAVDTVEFQSGSFSTFVVVSVRQKTVPPPEQTIVLTEASFQITWYDQKKDNAQATAWPVTVENKPETINITLQKSNGEDAGPNNLQYTVAGSGDGTLILIDGGEPTDTERGIYTCSCSGDTPSNIYTVTVSGLVEGTEYIITQNNTVSEYNPPEYEDNIKIKNFGKTFDVLIDKKWNDGQDSHTEEVVVTLTGTAGTTYSDTISINLPGRYGYSDEITDLPYRGDGKIITYSLTEALPQTLTGYGYSVTEAPKEGGVLYTIKNSRLKFSIQGNVVWDLQTEHTLPESLKLKLIRKGQTGNWEQVGEIQTVTAANSWAYEWKDLPQFVSDTSFPAEEYIYQLVATDLPEAFTPAVGTEGNQYHLKFVYEVVDVKVTTQWNDDGDRDGKRPGTSDYAPYLKLYIGDIEVQGATPTVTDNHDNTYTVSFGIKDKKKSGNPIDYKIRENKVPGYNTTSTSKYRIVNVGGTFLNTYRPAQTLITVIKRWNDRLDRDGLRADVVTRIELLKTVDGNTDIADSVTVQTADLVWTKVWSGLPVNEGGKPISYSVREIMINANGYTTDAEEPLRVLNGGKVTITDTHIPAPVVPPSRSSTTNRTGTTGTSTGSSSGSSGGSSGGGYYGGGYSSGTKSSIRNVKVFYWLRKQGGEPAAKTASVNHREGEAFAIYSPQIPGYQTNMTLVSGKMGVRDDVYHVIYKPMDYVLTIEFLDEKGETLAKAVTLQKMHIGDEYSVPVPEIAGYRAGLTVVQGIFTGNQRIRVVYIPDEYGYTVIEDYKIPRSFGAMPVNVGECWE